MKKLIFTILDLIPFLGYILDYKDKDNNYINNIHKRIYLLFLDILPFFEIIHKFFRRR